MTSNTPITHHLQVSAAVIILALAGCSSLSRQQKPAPNNRNTRTQLSIGYSLLYGEAEGIPKLRWLLRFKEKSSPMAQVTQDLMSYYLHLAADMKKLSQQYPAMRIDADTMSSIETEERKAIGDDQARDMAPIAGKKGSDFEREALLMFRDALNEQRHLLGVMLTKEPSPELREFLTTTKGQLDERYGNIGKLLDQRYFTH